MIGSETIESKSTFLISGASRGLGLSLAQYFAENGHRVFGCSRSKSDFQHDLYHHVTADVGSDADVKNIYREIRNLDGVVDVLINNAAISHNQLAILTSADEAELLLRTNVLGSFIILRETIKHMKRRKIGRIINMSSINVPLGSVGSSIYNGTKAAVESMIHSLTFELARDDITINTIGLSVVENTGMLNEVNDQALQRKLSNLSQPELISTSEITHAIDYFISPLARNITNQIVYFGGVR